MVCELKEIHEPHKKQFLTSTTIGGVAASVLGFDLTPAYAEVRELKIARTTETRSTCPYCSVSCGVIIHTLGDKSRNVEAAGRARRRRSRSPDQPGHALSQGHHPASRTSSTIGG